MHGLALALILVAPPKFSDEVDSLAHTALKSGARSLAVAAVKDGRVILAKGYSDDGKTSADSVFRIGSITKQFTAAVIVLMVREGKLGYDDTLGKLMPEVPADWHPVTVRQLLNHTSGIHSYTSMPSFWAISGSPVTPDGIWQHVAKGKPAPDFPIGSRWAYNNTGYCLLGSIIERVDRRPYFQSLRARILLPLGMRRTGEERNLPVIASFNAVGRPSAPLDMSWPYSAGAIVSTVRDLAKWDAALRGSFFARAERREMFHPDRATLLSSEPYGLGWDIMLRERRVIGVKHGGGINGFNSMIIRSLVGGHTVIVLNATERSVASPFAARMMELLEPNLLEKAEPIPDALPNITDGHKNLLVSLMAPKPSLDRFHPRFLASVTETELKSSLAFLASLGDLQQFQLLQSQSESGVLRRTYRARIGISDLVVVISEDSAGMIVGFSARPF